MLQRDETIAARREKLQTALGLPEGASPFPWQWELFDRLLRGEVPHALDIPTGLGKTSVMAIWLVARACGAKLPRRLVYVVDRRAVVDQATDVADGLRKLVNQDAELRKAIGLRDDQSLPISTLRGQHVDNREWLEDPVAPAIIVGTVDMVGSRLLFEGYGVSRKMRPYHAGLLGADTLLVLDEAHLVPPFEHLLRSVATEPALRSSDERVPPFRLLTLSATGRTRGDGVVGLTENDFEHDEVKKRLNAKKSLRIVPLDAGTKLENALAEHAWTLADDGNKAVRVLVYSDSREVARKADEHQSRAAKRARCLANALGFGDELVDVLPLAARLHDEGKRAARWQRAFHAPKDGVYAKTEGPIDYHLLDGCRHELGSLSYVEAHGDLKAPGMGDQNVVPHLVAAHDVFAIPLIGTTGCDDAPPSMPAEREARWMVPL